MPLLVILVPVLFGLMGFALDLGRLYLVRGELNQAASAMALAAAEQLLGTDASLGNATTAASQTLDNTNGFANKYNFGSLTLGEPNGNLSNTVNPPAYFATVAAAAGADSTAGQADGATARHALISLSADAPLLFWSLLSLGQSRKTAVAAVALAGISASRCRP
jgi:Flp pilus assembly protein TadG